MGAREVERHALAFVYCDGPAARTTAGAPAHRQGQGQGRLPRRRRGGLPRASSGGWEGGARAHQARRRGTCTRTAVPRPHTSAEKEAEQLSRFLTLGDGSPADLAALRFAAQVADAHAYDVEWQRGDVALIDNYLVMHARRAWIGDGPRKVLASLVNEPLRLPTPGAAS